ncbi:hypothetical protein F4778DRAFT_784747 [Xylariomycetidae sp. FL2044]|nr:hypothetical protein F4778DRAFT_784747 [Xylariomycetidae sp. FL2044]
MADLTHGVPRLDVVSKATGGRSMNSHLSTKSSSPGPFKSFHLTNIEPGGVKTNYATSSLKPMAKRHPAYSDPSTPSNQLLGHMQSEQGRSLWAEPSALAAAIYEVVSGGSRIPIRIPLGADAYGLISMDIEQIKKDLEEFKDISLGVGDAKQFDTIDFLKH